MRDTFTCRCHPFGSKEESDKAHSFDYMIDDIIQHRCDIRDGHRHAKPIIGKIIGIERPGFYVVRYSRTDHRLMHAGEIKLLDRKKRRHAK